MIKTNKCITIIIIFLIFTSCYNISKNKLATGAVLLQTLDQFHRPESVVFSLNGKYLYVGNCASDLFGEEKEKIGFLRGAGAISRCTVDENGNVEIEKQKFITGLNGPTGLCILPKATKKYPVGTLMVNQGMSLQVDNDGNSITNLEDLGVGVDFYDPNNGKLLGRIPMGPESKVATAIGHVPLLLNSMAFDMNGNLYITDTAIGGDRLTPRSYQYPGLIRIEHSSIDNLSEDGISFTFIPGVPNGIGFWEKENAMVLVTMGGNDKPGGTAIYKLPIESFPMKTVPAPLFNDVGRADGIAFSPKGTIITSRFSGDLLAIPINGQPRSLILEPFKAPADHRLLTLEDGSSILAVPEQDRTDPKPWNQNVKIIKIPKKF